MQEAFTNRHGITLESALNLISDKIARKFKKRTEIAMILASTPWIMDIVSNNPIDLRIKTLVTVLGVAGTVRELIDYITNIDLADKTYILLKSEEDKKQ
jgi:hypothetical protein